MPPQRPLRIALVAPLFESVPPHLYGGTERVVANLARGLVDAGHDVTLFASGDSRTKARLVPCVPQALRLSPQRTIDPLAYHMVEIGLVMQREGEFDLVHNHMGFGMFAYARRSRVPVLSTLHGRLDIPEEQAVLAHYGDVPLVSISDFQRRPAPHARWLRTVYHGLPMESFTPRATPGEYLAFLGRISPEKRPEWAIAIARKSGVPLKIAAKVDPADQDFYEAKVKPFIDGTFIEYVGEIGEKDKSEFLGKALGFVFPIDWPEPFGIAAVEAMACGTPVLARPCGSVPEIHRDGVTGVIRSSIEDLAAAVPTLAGFDRRAIRAYAEKRFSLSRMIEEYCHVYRQLIDEWVDTRRGFPGRGQPGQVQFAQPPCH